MKKRKEIINFFEKLGLSEKDATMYLYGLSVGPQHVSQLAKGCGVTRPNAYDVVKRLAEKGLCYNLGALYGRKVKMLSPDELGQVLERKQREIVELGNELKALVPDLHNLEKSPVVTQPRVTYFEGVEGVRKLFESSLQTSDAEVLSMLSEDAIFSVLGKEFINDYVRRRVAKGIVSRSIRPGAEETNDPLYRNHEKSLRLVRAKPDSIKIQATVLIFDNHVGFITVQEEPFGTLIESRDFAVTMRSWFDTLWEMSRDIA